jgi:hypothetical protein
MFDNMSNTKFQNKNSKWLDIGAGRGNFSIILYNRLNNGLIHIINDNNERHNHIIHNMIYMCEIQDDNIKVLQNIFGETSNIINNDFLQYNINTKFDFIIGNPPYNCNCIKKVPTNTITSKTSDGKTIWRDFIKKSLNLLNDLGELLVIIPSIWMKPDKEGVYNLLINRQINKIKCFSNSETNKLFNKHAQTPTCIVYLNNTIHNTSEKTYYIKLFDKTYDKYISYNFKYNEPIPLYGASIILKIKEYVYRYGNIHLIKTNLPSKKISISDIETKTHIFKNIKTCLLKQLKPTIILQYSDAKLPYHNNSKLIFSHKMYGFPVIDRKGEYGISNRDNYLYISDDIYKLEKIKAFFSTKFALFLYHATRYRMMYLEKYIFQLIPDITHIIDFPDKITDESIADFFNLTYEEIFAINNLHKKNYDFNINI